MTTVDKHKLLIKLLLSLGFLTPKSGPIETLNIKKLFVENKILQPPLRFTVSFQK